MKAIEELPTETVSVRRTDYPVRVIDGEGNEVIHLIEFQSDWEADKLLSMIQYKARYQEKYGLPVKSTMILFNESGRAVDHYKDEELHFTFHLVKIWEIPAADFLKSGCLLPLVPLMKDGLPLAREVEERIYGIEEDNKLDMLTIFGILLGLRDKGLAQEYYQRRRDIMIKSPMYDWIIEEGVEKGVEKGRKEGIEEGIEIGIEKGIEKGEHANAIKNALAMKKEGFAVDLIARITGLTTEEIESLKE